MRILISGPDGTGKTSLADILEAIFTTQGRSVRRLHYRPQVILGTRRISGECRRKPEDPHGAPPHGRLRSFGKLVLTLGDFVVFELTRTRRSSGIVQIQERGWWDQVADFERYRLHPSMTWCASVMGHLIPRADLCVTLTGDAEVIHSRKAELTTEEITRQLAVWRRIRRFAGKRYVDIDVELPSAAAAQQLLSLVEEL